MKKVTFLALAMSLILTSTKLFAQNNFNGTWNFKDQESVSGNLYANGSPSKVTISLTGTDQKMDYVTSDGQNYVPSVESFISGKPFETKTKSGRKKTVILTWASDKTSFTEVSSIYSLTDANKLDFKNTDVWTISDGKLILDHKNENYTNAETWESRATYEKQ